MLLNQIKQLEQLLKSSTKGNSKRVRVNGTSNRGHSAVYIGTSSEAKWQYNIQLIQQSHHSACKYGNVAALKMLIDYGAKPHIQNTLGTTPLHAAAQSGHNEVIKVDKINISMLSFRPRVMFL